MEVLDLPSSILDQFRTLPDVKTRQQTTFGLWRRVAEVLTDAGVEVSLARPETDFRAKTLQQSYYNILRHIRRGVRAHQAWDPEWRTVLDKWSRPQTDLYGMRFIVADSGFSSDTSIQSAVAAIRRVPEWETPDSFPWGDQTAYEFINYQSPKYTAQHVYFVFPDQLGRRSQIAEVQLMHQGDYLNYQRSRAAYERARSF